MVVKDWHLPSIARKEEPALGEAHRRTGGGRAQERGLRALRPAVAGRARRQPGPARRGQRRVIDCDDPTAPTEVTICEREPEDGAVHQLPFALTPAIDRSARRSCASRSTRRPQHVGAGAARTARHRDRRHPAAPTPRAPAAARRCRIPATPPPTSPPPCSTSTTRISPCTARPAPARPSRRRRSSRRLVNEHGGASASSRSHTRWWRTCSAIVIKAEVDPARIAKKDSAAGVALAGDRQGRLRRLHRRPMRAA